MKKLEMINAKDPFQMNWIEGKHSWGTVICPKSLKVTTHREIMEDGSVIESYIFKNTEVFPVTFLKKQVGIYAPFHDDYENAKTCMTNRCHTHLCCVGEAFYIRAIRMGGQGPHLGLQLLRGSISSYSVDRELEKQSNDRGDFILHPDLPILSPGEQYEIAWKLFWYEDTEDFKLELKKKENYPVIQSKKAVFFVNENAEFTVSWGGELENTDVIMESSDVSLNSTIYIKEKKAVCSFVKPQAGEVRITVRLRDCRCDCRYWVSDTVDELTSSRCQFIAEHQQYHEKDNSLDGAYLIYDNEEESMYYSHLDDHNGGRERLGMGALMALYLQKEDDLELEKSLMAYVEYVYRELYDDQNGTVFNDIQRNLDWNRLYNYPWMAVFQLEVFKWTKDTKYLMDAFQTMKKYYEYGGHEFYAIGIPMTELMKHLKKNQKSVEAKMIQDMFLRHADHILDVGLDYPESEVKYEQSIVAPAVSYLLQAYELTAKETYLEAAREQMKVLVLFNGQQPDYHMFENAIRHWDGYWFGKRRRYGDTFPHYWSVLSGIVFAQYAEITGDAVMRQKAEASFRGCLNLFAGNGKASCAMVYPLTVNGEEGHYYDPWANDQDWALYYALKYQEGKII